MQVSFSTKSIFGLSRISFDPYSVLDTKTCGITLDAESFYSRNVLENHGIKEFDADASRERFTRLVQDCTRNHVPLNSMLAPKLRWDTKRTDLNGLMLQIGKNCIRACAGTGCEYVVIQPLFSGISGDSLWKENHRYYSVLGQTAKETGVKILMENQCGCIGGHLIRGACADAAMAAEWIDKLNEEAGEEVFGFCLDTGACNLCRQDMGEIAVTLGDKVKAVLVRECDGIHEAARLPFTGRNAAGEDVEWQGLIRGLRKIEFDGILIMDAGDTLRGFPYLLRTHIYQVIRSAADYLKWQIEIERCMKKYPVRILFGAGNMCRQYMACYGKLYPPLFICDNNPMLWGTKIYGVEIKSPEKLKNLPEECVVIICSIFYEVIAEQLKDMGIRRIGTFNDDCLPVDFHG